MSSFKFQPRGRQRRTSLALMLNSVLLTSSLVVTPGLFAAGPGEASHEGHATPVSMPGWAEALKSQTLVEDAIEGRAGRSEKLEMQHNRLMRRLEEQAQRDAGAANVRGLQSYIDDAPVYGRRRIKFPTHVGCEQGRAGLDVGGQVPGRCTDQTVRHLDDQH